MRKLVILMSVLAVAGISAATAMATNTHYVTGPTCANTDSNTLSCAGKVAGLGSSTGIFVVVEANAGCTTQPGSNNPPGQRTFSASGPFSSDKNGNFVFGGVLAHGPATCPGNQFSFISSAGSTVSIYDCGSGGPPTFSISKKGQATQTNPNCTLVLGPTAAG